MSVLSPLAAVFAVLGLARWFRGRRDGALRRLTDSELAQRCSDTGGQIQDFVTERTHSKPHSMLRQPPEAERALIRSRQLHHDLVTRSAYEQHFSGSVSRLVTELRRRGHVQLEDTAVLGDPENVAGIDHVGGRLVKLATSGGREESGWRNF